VNGIAYWGIWLVLVAQLYFCLHLQTLLRVLRTVSVSETWMGLYESPAAKVLTGLTTIVVPLGSAAVLVVATGAGFSGWADKALYTGVLGVLGTAIAIGRAMVRIWALRVG
jgi:hypothetical protein